MSVNLKLPFGEYLLASIREYRSEQKGQGEIADKMWFEFFNRSHDAWHAFRKPKRAPRAPFVPPTPAEVTEYSISIGWPLDGEAWCLGYACKGWCTSGSAKMKDWKLAVQKWKREGIHTKITPKGAPAPVVVTVAFNEPKDWIERLRAVDPDHHYAKGNPVWTTIVPYYQKEIRRLIGEK